MKKSFILISLITIIIVLSFIRTVISNTISTSGVELGKTQDQIKAYQTENLSLKEKINDLSSLTYISTVAAKMGFSESKSNFAVSSSRPIALRQ